MVLESLVLRLFSVAFESVEITAAIMAVATLGASIWWWRNDRRPSKSTPGMMRKSSSENMKKSGSNGDLRNSSKTESNDDNNEGPPPTSGGEVEYERLPYDFQRLPEGEMVRRSEEFYELMNKRRTIRSYSPEPVPKAVLENILKTAGSSPSGANAQPWTYVVVSDPAVKEEIRRIVELEEEINYERRMGKQWVDDLKPFKLSWVKPYLTEAPHLVLVFKQLHSYDPDTGKKRAHYYQEISTCLSVGMLLAAIQNAGLVTLTSTPLNCGPGLRTLLNRPEEEKLILLLPIGYPAEDATVPKLERKELSDFVVMV